MSMPKEEIIGMVLEMYDARKEAKEYLEFYANPDEDGKLEEYKKYRRVLSIEGTTGAKDQILDLSESCF